MKTAGALSLDELESLIEQKILEVLGGPDSGLELKDGFKEKLKARLASSGKRISHREVTEKFG